MALITPSTFDPLKFRCNVRLQQGVPIVDADWNELDDIRKFEMRAYLKWFVGDGVPEGVDAFRITALPGASATDLLIQSGATPAAPGTPNGDVGLRNVGRFIVDGLDVLIGADVKYKSQTLPAGVPAIADIPNIVGAVAIYLDVWERLITSQEDPSLILPGLGVESAARMKREWCVRARAGATAPKPGEADFVAGHSYALLATLDRKMNGGNPVAIAPADLTDQRHARLTLAAMESRLAALEQLLLAPSLTPPHNEFDPKVGPPGTVVKLLGSNLYFGPKDTKFDVKFGNVSAKLTGQQSSSQVFVLAPQMPTGLVAITLTNAGGSVTSVDTYNMLAPPGPAFGPTPQFNPPKAPANLQTQVTLVGTHFNQPPVSVSINGVNAPIFGPVQDGQVTVTVGPVAAPGSFTFRLQNAGGTVDTTDKFQFT